jgi:hypothetical protein
MNKIIYKCLYHYSRNTIKKSCINPMSIIIQIFYLFLFIFIYFYLFLFLFLFLFCYTNNADIIYKYLPETYLPETF